MRTPIAREACETCDEGEALSDSSSPCFCAQDLNAHLGFVHLPCGRSMVGPGHGMDVATLLKLIPLAFFRAALEAGRSVCMHMHLACVRDSVGGVRSLVHVDTCVNAIAQACSCASAL